MNYLFIFYQSLGYNLTFGMDWMLIISNLKQSQYNVKDLNSLKCYLFIYFCKKNNIPQNP